ncbi:hypothetical protein CR513_04179, partial [Mucuna pruriens]
MTYLRLSMRNCKGMLQVPNCQLCNYSKVIEIRMKLCSQDVILPCPNKSSSFIRHGSLGEK